LATVLRAEAVRERSGSADVSDEAVSDAWPHPTLWAPASRYARSFHGYERQFTLRLRQAFSPLQGDLDWSLTQKMNTAQMTAFLSQVSQAHPQEFIVMVVDAPARTKPGI